MDYLLSVLVIIVIYLVINLIRRSPKPTYRKPEEERVNSLFNIASGLLKERGMQWLMLQDYSFRTTISKPGSIPLEETQQQLQSALTEILSHVHIMPDVRLEVTNNPADLSGPDRAGEYSYNKVVRVLVSASHTAEGLLEVLCHETTHYIMHVKNLSLPVQDNDMTEGLTEVTACLLGFSEAMIASDSTRNPPYLNKPEFQKVRKLLLERRAVLQKKDRAAELKAATEQLRKNLASARTMMEQTSAMMAVNKTPTSRRMSKASFKRL